MPDFDNDAPEYPGPSEPPEFLKQKPNETLGQMQQAPAQPEKKTNVLAILSLVLAIPFGLVGLILGIIALVQIGKDPSQKGKGLAIAGIIVSILIGPLIFLIAIGSFAYFGVLSPNTMLPSRCMIAAGFECQEYSVRTSGEVTLRLVNKKGSDIQKATMAMETECAPKDAYWAADQPMTFRCIVAGGEKGERLNTVFSLNYMLSGGAYPQTASGNLMIQYT